MNRHNKAWRNDIWLTVLPASLFFCLMRLKNNVPSTDISKVGNCYLNFTINVSSLCDMPTNQSIQEAVYTGLKESERLTFRIKNLGNGIQSLEILRYYQETDRQEPDCLATGEFQTRSFANIRNILLELFQQSLANQDDFRVLYEQGFNEGETLFMIRSRGRDSQHLRVIKINNVGERDDLFQGELLDQARPDLQEAAPPDPHQDDSSCLYDYLIVLQDNLDLLYKEKLADVAGMDEDPPDRIDALKLWFFMEYWKLSLQDPVLSEFQEQIRRINPELGGEKYSLEKPEFNAGAEIASDSLEDYISLYYGKKKKLQAKTFAEMPIDPEKRRQLQSVACVLVDKMDKAGTAVNRRLEAFLGLVSLRSIVGTGGSTHFNE